MRRRVARVRDSSCRRRRVRVFNSPSERFATDDDRLATAAHSLVGVVVAATAVLPQTCERAPLATSTRKARYAACVCVRPFADSANNSNCDRGPYQRSASIVIAVAEANGRSLLVDGLE